MNSKKIWVFVFGILAVLTSCVIYQFANKREVVVVDVLKLADEFTMKKELEKEVEPALVTLRNKADSMNTVFELVSKTQKPNAEIENEMAFWQEKLEQAYQVSNTNINERIWKRLNPLIDEFGKKNNYKMIIGANGMGTVLYNDEVSNVTKQAIQYVNEKYQHGEK